MKHYAYFIMILFVAIAGTTLAQDDDLPTITDIQMDSSVSETITDHAFFDWWHLQAEEGDVLGIEMFADEGLIPLLGLLDENGDLLARSDEESIAEVNGVAYLEYTVETAGNYTIVATRDGRDQGTTTGAYRLSLANLSANTKRENPFTETEFRCGENLLTTALVLRFVEDVNITPDTPATQVTESYRISVYGLDGFEPMIRSNAEVNPDAPLDCSDSATAVAGSSVDLPQLDEIYTAQAGDDDHVAMVSLTNTGPGKPFGIVTFTVGAKADSSGRFIVVLEGLAIQHPSDIDQIQVRVGPFAHEKPVTMYMIGNPDNRLDPVLNLLDEQEVPILSCDDAGRSGCAEVPSIVGSSVFVKDSNRTYIGDRFDAGLILLSDDTKPISVSMQSRESNTEGGYTLVFIGELPAR